MRYRLFAAIVLIVLLASSCHRERLAAPPPGLHRRADRAITYFLDEGASDAVELAVRESFQLWSDATIFKFTYGGKAPGRIARDGRNMVVMMKRWPKELPIDSVAWSQLYLDASGDIVESDILLNDEAFTFTTRREAKADSIYIEDVLAKAIGKALGIGLGTGDADDSVRGYRVAAAGLGFEPGIDPAEMAAYLSLYEAKP
jgi:hypothetical protein